MEWSAKWMRKTSPETRRKLTNWIWMATDNNIMRILSDLYATVTICIGCVPVDDVYLYMHVICENALNDMVNRVTVMASLWHEMTSTLERRCQTTPIMCCTYTQVKSLKTTHTQLMRLRSIAVCEYSYFGSLVTTAVKTLTYHHRLFTLLSLSQSINA